MPIKNDQIIQIPGTSSSRNDWVLRFCFNRMFMFFALLFVVSYIFPSLLSFLSEYYSLPLSLSLSPPPPLSPLFPLPSLFLFTISLISVSILLLYFSTLSLPKHVTQVQSCFRCKPNKIRAGHACTVISPEAHQPLGGWKEWK